MMKQDPLYNKEALHKHGLSGLEDEICYRDQLRYAIMLDNAVYWLEKLEKSERKDCEIKRAQENALFCKLLHRCGR
jgi:hypothetical protein